MLAAGYAPAVGFLHTGKPLSFVYDIADLFKFDTVVPVAFRVAGQHANGRSHNPVREVRLSCRDEFRRTGLLKKLIPMIEDVLRAGDVDAPIPPKDAVQPAFEDAPSDSDDGHRG